MSKNTIKTIIVILLLVSSNLIFAGESASKFIVTDQENIKNPIKDGNEKPFYWDAFDKIWGIPTLYKNDENPLLQQLTIFHRFQYQFAKVDSDQGDNEIWDTRRWRLGGKIRFLKYFDLVMLNDLDNEGLVGTQEEFVYRISHLVLGIKLPGNHKFSIGNWILGDSFNQEISVSEIFIPTVERALLSNQTGFALYLSGAKLSGKINDDLNYMVGIWSGNRNHRHELFSDFDAGIMSAFKLTYDVGKKVDWADKGKISLHYRYNSSEENRVPPYEHLVSLASSWKMGKFGLATDVIGGSGIGNGSDIFGVVLLPTLEIWDGPIGKFELVGRYHYAKSSDNNGLGLAGRYERQAPNITGSAGDEYNSIYAGLNWYLYNHKLKVMTGVEFSKMEDSANDGGEFDGKTFFAGVRMYF